MQLHTIVDHHAAYDLWANSLFVKRLDREPPELLDREVRSSFPTLRATILHIRDAQNAWLNRLLGKEVRWPAEDDTAIGTLLKYNVRLRDHVAGLTEAGALRIVAYKDSRGREHQNAVWQMLMHCFNHGSYHRGQLVTMMRVLEMDEIPASDMIIYYRSLKQG
jgi:uncharacterized damage-inducible protein DinB